MAGVGDVFPGAEHRECMFHLASNFKKQHRGKVFDDHLWAASYSWNPYLFAKHWAAMEEAKPAATNYLRKCHTRGPPKKKAKLTKTSESSIVPLDDAPATSMYFPPSSKNLDITSSKHKKKDTQSTSSNGPSKSLETTSKTKRKNDTSASGSKRSRSGSNQPEPLSIELPTLDAPPAKQKIKKKVPTKKTTSIPMPPLDSPAMGTRSKKVVPGSPAMSTRSKRRLSM